MKVKKEPMTAMTFHLPIEMEIALSKIADNRLTTKSELLRRLISNMIRREEFILKRSSK